jgi:hypothetical protein
MRRISGSRKLFTLAVLAVALGIAWGSSTLFGVSLALGAFFAGVILSESPLSHKAGEDSLPLQDAFAVLFFVSVGMLVDTSARNRPLSDSKIGIPRPGSANLVGIECSSRYPARLRRMLAQPNTTMEGS